MSDKTAARKFRVLGHRVEQVAPQAPIPIEVEGIGNGTVGPTVLGLTADGRAVPWRNDLGRLRVLGLLARAEPYSRSVNARGASPAIERVSWGFVPSVALRDVMLHDADPESPPRFGELVYADGHDLLLDGALIAPNQAGPIGFVRASRVTNASDSDGHTERVVLAQVELLSFVESELLQLHPRVRGTAAQQLPHARTRPGKVSAR
jgi:hypothetical protein